MRPARPTIKNTNVIIGADNRPLAFLKQEFPHLQFIEFPGYKFSYPVKGSMALKMALSAPNILLGIKKENKILDELIAKFNIDAVISDNRFGLFNNAVTSIFITHQIYIKSSFLKSHELDSEIVDYTAKLTFL